MPLNSETFVQQQVIKPQTVARDARWQNSRAERRGQVLQEIFNKMNSEEAIDDVSKNLSRLYTMPPME